VCDAGTTIWVQRVFPLVLGRKTHGAAEVDMWAAVADKYGRDAVVRALTQDAGYSAFWKQMISDMLYVARAGPDLDLTCFESPELLVHDGSLAGYLRETAPDDGNFGARFDMADVILDGLAADDLEVIWQANVFARTNYVAMCNNSLDLAEIEEERRVALGDEFLATYLNRSLTCIACHNSEFSVTDDPDPALDRTWGVAAYFEKALFASSSGPVDAETYYAMHRYYELVNTDLRSDYPIRPWGMDAECGTYRREPPAEDFTGQDTSYFGSEFGTQGSLWDIQAMLASGAGAMTGSMLTINADESVAPDEALAYLTAQHVVDQVWDYAMGASLTIPYGFSRNQAQQQQLEALTDQFATDGWSLRELLVSIATNPLFNAGMPETCGAAPYGIDPILNPYSVLDANPDLHGNGPSDLVHRQFARALIRSARDELQWPPIHEFFGTETDNADYDLEIAMGVFLSRSVLGSNGTDFQGALAWEKAFGTCSDPKYPNDFLAHAKLVASQADATVETLALAVKDRLTSHGAWQDDEERDLAEDLLAVPLDAKVREVDAATLDRNLGLFCGAVTLSPDFFVTLEPRLPGPVPPLPLDYGDDCEAMVALLALQGIDASCDNWIPVL
jgi:hypothetical protein